MPRPSSIHRAQSMLCAAYSRHLDNEIHKAHQLQRMDNLASRHHQNHTAILARARAARTNGALHAQLLRTAQTHRLYYVQLRAVRA